MDLACTWIAGPDAGAATTLPTGRGVVGRAPTADLRCADPALQPHHALLDHDASGTVELTPLTGRVAVNGRPVEGPTVVEPGSRIELGHSVLTLGPSPAFGPVALHGTAVVRTRRPPVPAPAAAPVDPPELPAAEERPGGLLPAAIALAGSGAMAAILGQPMFLLFGALGASVALGSWGAQWVARARRRRRAVAAHRAAVEAAELARAHARLQVVAASLAVAPGLAAARRTVEAGTSDLWARRVGDPDAFTVALGHGSAWWGDEQVGEVPVAAGLGPDTRLALTGPKAALVARAMVVQLVAQCGPADLRVVVVTPHAGRWLWLQGLPHATLPDGAVAVVGDDLLAETLATLQVGPPAAGTEGEPQPAVRGAHLVLITDHAPWLAARTSQLRRALHAPGTALLAVLEAEATVPHWCTSVLTTNAGPAAGWVDDTAASLLPTRVHLAGCSVASAADVVAALGELTDPEDPLAAAAAMPRTVALGQLLGSAAANPAAIRARWAAAIAAGTPAELAPRTVLGVAGDGAVDIDLVRDGPHGLVAGTTGAGKSELLRSLVAGLAVALPPTHLTFVLVDYKGGATFDACARLPHVVGVVTDLDDQLADRALRSLHAELRRRERLLRDHGVADLAELWARQPDVVLPRLVVVIDEFAALVAEQPAFLHALVGVAQRGRSLGVHLILATQRPQGVISDDIRANTNLRIALRLQDATEAMDVVGDRGPATLSRTLPGRAVLRLGPSEHVTFQAAACTVPDGAGVTDLDRVVQRVAEAARQLALPPAGSPWLPPLPTDLPRHSLADGAIGLVDAPDLQAQHPLRWQPADGGVLVAGSAGSGLASTLSLMGGVARDVGAHVVALALTEGSLQCAGADIVSVASPERVLRLLHHLRRPLATPTLLLVHELDLVRRLLDQPDTQAMLDSLDSVLDGTGADPSGAPLTVVVGVRQPSAVPARLAHGLAHRWVLHLDDPHEAGLLGVGPGAVPAKVPGRVHLAGEGLTAQLVRPVVVSETVAPADGGQLRQVPARLEHGALPAGRVHDGALHLPFALEVESGEASVLHLTDGDHVLVVGPARSGRSTTLVTLVAAWRTAVDGGVVVALVPRRSPVAHAADVVHDRRSVADAVAAVEAAATTGPVLFVVDDADAVDDSGGSLAALLAAGRPGLLVLAGGRADALRQSYGHWTATVRRSRVGVVHTGGSDLDGDLFNMVLPRRLAVRPRPGLVWALDGGAPILAQVALPPGCPSWRATTVDPAQASRLAAR